MRKLTTALGILGLGLVAMASGSINAGAATATTYVKTVVGTDFHALDARDGVMFVPSTGGGAYLYGNEVPGTHYMEVNVDLPVGANVKQATIYYKDCFDPDGNALATWYFGAYNPSGQFTYLAPSKSRKACSFSMLGLGTNGDVRVSPNWRYTIGMATILREAGAPNSNPPIMVRGARISYTCPTKCLP